MLDNTPENRIIVEDAIFVFFGGQEDNDTMCESFKELDDQNFGPLNVKSYIILAYLADQVRLIKNNS